MNLSVLLVKDSDFEQWRVTFIDFIASRENGENMIKSFTKSLMGRTDNKMEKYIQHKRLKDRKQTRKLRPT